MSRTFTRDEVAQVLETMLRIMANHATPAGAGYRTAVREVLRRLDALPDAPESKRPILDLYGLKGAVQRPRATTPTPEGPALSVLGFPVVAESGIPAGEVHLRQEGKPVVRITNAEPTAPEVVWEGEGLRVKASGDAYVAASEGRWLYINDDRFQALSRALAEAKRDVSELEQEVALKQAALNGNARDFRDAREAAESMRERAAKAAEAEHDAAEKRRATLVSGGYARLVQVAEEQSLTATRIADDIRALPLEER